MSSFVRTFPSLMAYGKTPIFSMRVLTWLRMNWNGSRCKRLFVVELAKQGHTKKQNN